LQRVVDLITITLRKGERALVCGNSERLDFTQGADRAELFVDLAPGLPQFASSYVGELVERLHADDPAVREQKPSAFCPWFYRSHGIQEDIGIEKRAHPARRRRRGELRYECPSSISRPPSIPWPSSRWLAASRSNFQPAGNFQLLFRRISIAL